MNKHLCLLFLILNQTTYAGINDSIFMSTQASAKVAYYKAKTFYFQQNKKEQNDNAPLVYGKNESKQRCGIIKLTAYKGQPLIVLGDIINLARCKR